MSNTAIKSKPRNSASKSSTKSGARRSTKSKSPSTSNSKTKWNTPTRPSALDAAVTILSKSNKPMSAKSLIEAMASEGLWTSPNGKTPAATLYASIIREINKKGKDARFVKVDRGQFSLSKKGGK